MQSRSAFLLLLCLLSVAACKKQTGPPGPAGDQGIPGPAGTAGQPGDNISVVASGNLVVSESQWITPDSTEWRASITTNLITQQVVDSGYVQAFLLRNGDWINLPHFESIYFISYAYEAGKLTLIKGSTHGNLPPKPGTDTYRFSAFRN